MNNYIKKAIFAGIGTFTVNKFTNIITIGPPIAIIIPITPMKLKKNIYCNITADQNNNIKNIRTDKSACKKSVNLNSITNGRESTNMNITPM